MWLSKVISKTNDNAKAERGMVTISNDREIEIGASVLSRNVNSYAPYGYNAVAPAGEEVILVPSSDGQVALGTKVDVNCLENGEIKISSKGGASIVLKNDGTIMLNSMIINKEGVIQA